jgi:hypothetical protein
MMAEIVSLKQQRKRRERDARADTLRDKAAKDLDGHKR